VFGCHNHPPTDAKFIPGINAMAAPMAGSMRMRFDQFLWLDLTGASLCILTFKGLGYLFHSFLAVITRSLGAAGRVAESGALLPLAAYAGYRLWLFRKGRMYRVAPRVQVEELTRAFVIVGGLTAWRKAGQSGETVPADDLVHLPHF
jgi:hypothetical protein